MKTLSGLLLVASLALNIVVLGVFIAGRNSPPPAAPIATAPAKPAASSPAFDLETWPALQTKDLPALVQRLRERGFPPEIIRGIVSAQLREAYMAREKALDPDMDNRPFWKAYSIDPRVQAARMQLYREQQATLRSLLGSDAEPRENINLVYQGRRFETVPQEKVEEVQRVLREFDDARNDMYSSVGGGMIGPETQKKVAALENEQRNALARILTPQELEEWDLRNSNTARNLRYQLSAFDATEAEYRTIYKLQAEFDQRFGMNFGMTSPEEQQKRGEAQNALNEQIKAALGGTRATEYERANDYNYRQTSQLVARLELPPATTDKVYEIQKEMRGRLDATMKPITNPAEREQALRQLASETETRVTAILGPKGYEAYKQYGGSWMQMFRPRPPRNNP